jgi:hypothetical protein
LDHYTVGKILDGVSAVLWSRLSLELLKIPVQATLLDTDVNFQKRRNFQNVGCTDGKHILTKCPSITGTMIYNYK